MFAEWTCSAFLFHGINAMMTRYQQGSGDFDGTLFLRDAEAADPPSLLASSSLEGANSAADL